MRVRRKKGKITFFKDEVNIIIIIIILLFDHDDFQPVYATLTVHLVWQWQLAGGSYCIEQIGSHRRSLADAQRQFVARKCAIS